MTGKDDPTISCSHLMVELSVLVGRKIKGVVTTPIGGQGLKRTTFSIVANVLMFYPMLVLCIGKRIIFAFTMTVGIPFSSLMIGKLMLYFIHLIFFTYLIFSFILSLKAPRWISNTLEIDKL